MTKNRNKLEIYIDVLNVIKSGTSKPTRIMYGSNLSWVLLQSILKSMIAQDLISYNKEQDSYIVTKKGVAVIKYFERAKDLVNSE